MQQINCCGPRKESFGETTEDSAILWEINKFNFFQTVQQKAPGRLKQQVTAVSLCMLGWRGRQLWAWRVGSKLVRIIELKDNATCFWQNFLSYCITRNGTELAITRPMNWALHLQELRILLSHEHLQSNAKNVGIGRPMYPENYVTRLIQPRGDLMFGLVIDNKDTCNGTTLVTEK